MDYTNLVDSGSQTVLDCPGSDLRSRMKPELGEDTLDVVRGGTA
jgi:hypothetical protein